jgi:hypothetical protein
MGSSKSTQTQNQTSNQMSRYTVDPRSGSEQQILNQLQGYGNNQLSFLNTLMNGGVSPFALSPADQAQLDQAYSGAMNRFNQEGRDMADYLATTRGLNKSDTPVGQQVMDRYGMGMADLLSQKANAGLNMGLQGTGLRLQGSQALPSGLTVPLQLLNNERMATGTQTGSGFSNGTSTMRYTPSIMSQIGQGMGLAAGAGLMAGGLMTGNPMMSMGGLGMGSKGMGSGAGANSWFGNSPGGQLGGMPTYFMS